MKVIFQGTFDPFTSGHLEVVKSALAIFDEVRILLLVNPDKTPLFSLEERIKMIRQSVTPWPQVTVDSYDGLLVDYMQQHGYRACVRGVRNETDVSYELANHHLSQQIYPDLQTLFLPCAIAYHKISSSAVKAACSAGKLPAAWVPKPVAVYLKKKFPSLTFL